MKGISYGQNSYQVSPEMQCHMDAILHFTEGSGLVRVPNPRQYDLPESVWHTDTGDEGYAISAVHQIHCLVCLPRRIWSFSDDSRKCYDMLLFCMRLMDQSSAITLKYIPCIVSTTVRPFPFGYLASVNHYIIVRQGIMCCGDTTLEPFAEDSMGLFVDGIGMSHQCRDWNTLSKFMVKNRLEE